MQPQVGVGITADDLTDPDGLPTARDNDMIAVATYQWYRTSSRTGTGTKIQIGGVDATGATYTPRATAGDTDVRKYLRVVATYIDGIGGGSKTATAVSDYMSIGEVANNTPPDA